ncbi:MAG: GNAT family N-acetyltransferase [Spirochaetes bacterium]|jgi:GNAT superfamily N-acetyltransferase|nr:GNAT family N-acetyltransferase [Spirochaetota bacterium]
MISLKKTVDSEIDSLVGISKRAFYSDFNIGAPSEDVGPPGYYSPQWHHKMLQGADGFFSIYNNEKLAGAALVFCEKNRFNGVYNLGRIWIDPVYHRQGIGLTALELVIEQFPEAILWKLDTPAWNKRTRSFYLKAGFTISKEQGGFLFFEKEI